MENIKPASNSDDSFVIVQTNAISEQDRRIRSFAAKVFAGLAIAVVVGASVALTLYTGGLIWLVLLAAVVPILRGLHVYNRSLIQPMKEQLGARALEMMRKEFDRVPHGVLGKELSRLQTWIQDETASPAKRMKQLRKQIANILKTEAYKQNKKNKNDKSILFIQKLAHLITVHSEGASIYEDFGHRCVPESMKEFNWEQAAQVIDDAHKTSHGFSADSKFARLPHAVSHPNRTLASMTTNHERLGAGDYNAHEHGNFNTKFGVYTVNGKEIDVYLGPGPSNDILFAAHLQYLQNTGKGRHLQHILENPHHSGEAARRFKIGDFQTEFPDQIEVFATPLDGDAWKGKGLFATVTTPVGFRDAMSQFLKTGAGCQAMDSVAKQDNGFYLPKTTLDEREVEDALEACYTAFENLHLQSYPKKLSKVMLLAFGAILAAKEMTKLADKLEDGERGSFGQACKQDIDRGVVMNMAMHLLASGKDKMTPSELALMAGIVEGRAQLVEDRKILKDRLEALTGLLHLVGANSEAFLAPIRDYLGAEISFTPTSTLQD